MFRPVVTIIRFYH